MIRRMGMVVLLLMVGKAAWADKFQIKEKRQGKDFDVPFATVELKDGTRIGQTDKYGRFTITNLANGRYEVKVVYDTSGARTRTATLTINGGSGLKVIYLE